MRKGTRFPTLLLATRRRYSYAGTDMGRSFDVLTRRADRADLRFRFSSALAATQALRSSLDW